jgi:hypothetical protein
MPKIEIPFATQEGESSVAQNSQEVLVNMFAEVETSGRRKITRRQRAALASVYAKTGEKRCIEKTNDGRYLCVIGNGFYRFDGTTLTLLDTIGSSSGRCTLITDDNGNVLISDGISGYYWNGSTITTVSAPTAIGHVTFQGGFGIYPVPNAGQFYVTNINALNVVDALDFATAESNPDNIVRAFIDHNELWLFGNDTTEIWQLSGAADFPFAPFANSQMERGCGAAFSVVHADNTVFWLGNDWSFYRADGYRPLRVSTHSVERAIEQVPLSARPKADAFVYSMGGHKFYTVNFPGYLSVQYNIATGWWNVAKSYGHDDWVVMGSAGLDGDYFMTGAGIVRMDPTLNEDEGGILERGGTSAPVYAEGKRIRMRGLRLDCEVGKAPIGVEPQIMVQIALDGETFGNERWRSFGLTGNYRRKVWLRNCGMGERIAVRYMVTDNARFSVVGSDAILDVASS